MPEHLAAAARRRHDDACHRAENALQDLCKSGESVTFAAVARRGAVSTDFLYNQPDLRQKIIELRSCPPGLRGTDNHADAAMPPHSDSATAAVRALSSQIKALKRAHAEEISSLRDALATAQGENLILRRKMNKLEPRNRRM